MIQTSDTSTSTPAGPSTVKPSAPPTRSASAKPSIPSISAQQVAIVQWIARMGAVSTRALAVHEDTTPASASGRLAALKRRGWLSARRVLAGGPTLYTVTAAGMRASSLRGLDPCRVSNSNAAHLATCAEVAAQLERRYPDHRVLGERELRRDERERGAVLASARLAGISADGGPKLHRPDLVLWPRASAGAGCGAGDRSLDPEPGRGPEPESEFDFEPLPVAVEVELTVKGPERLTGICLAWARCRTVAGVLYLAPPEVQRALQRAIARAQAQEQVVVVGLDALCEP
jgi:hypothetical protein